MRKKSKPETPGQVSEPDQCRENVMKESATEPTHQTNETPATPIIVRPAKRTRWAVNSRCKQRVLLIADDSSSMEGQKAVQAHEGCQKLIATLSDPANKDGFRVAVAGFNSHARGLHSWGSAAAIAGNLAPFNPTGCTNFEEAFDLALRMFEDAQKQDQKEPDVTWLKPVIFLYSDGQLTQGGDPQPLATELKKIADIVTIAVGDDADEVLLRALATSSEHFYQVRNTAHLRSFLADAGPTLTQSFQRGENATQAMTQLQSA